MNNIERLYLNLHELVIFRNFLTDPVGAAFCNMLKSCISDTDSLVDQTSACSAFAAALFPVTTNLSHYIRDFVSSDDNFYIRRKAQSVLASVISETKNDLQPLSTEDKLQDTIIQYDLQVLSRVASFKCSDLMSSLNNSLHVTAWEISPVDLNAVFQKTLEELPLKGYGIYAKHSAFSVQNGEIIPVHQPDFGRLSLLTGYEKERQLVENNTLSLLEGKTFCNVLLYGDAGTGKSSTVKALAGEYADQGLRLVEIRKNQLFELPPLLNQLSEIPLKFIIFIDDLSLADDDGDFSALKAIIEGSVTGCGKNIAIYATSNRRHLVKERMADRAGDDIHISDTLQEVMSLSARFGLTVTFLRPEKDLYLDIVKNLAASYGLDLNPQELNTRAEAFAIRAGGRSPRAAKQFVLNEKSQNN